MIYKTAPLTGRRVTDFLLDSLPYLGLTLLAMAAMYPLGLLISNPWALLTVQGLTGVAVYAGIARLLNSTIQKDVLSYIRKR